MLASSLLRRVWPWVVALLLSAPGLPLHAQPAPPLVPIDSIQADRDGDLTSDRMGDTLRVAGRATVASGTLDEQQLQIYIQNRGDSTGLKLYSSHMPTPVARGDSVVARGVVGEYQGATQLYVTDYRVIETGAPPIEPADLSLNAANGEKHEGLLAHVEGQIINMMTNQGGRLLVINEPGNSEAVLDVFISNYPLPQFDLSSLEVGDRIAVTGILTQYDTEPPHDDFYEIVPRTASDLQAAGLTQRVYRRAIIIGGIVLLLSVIMAVLFRRQVRERTQELAESEARFRRLAESTFEGILFHDDGRILDTNEAFLQLTGYDRDALIGRMLTELLDASSREALRAAYYEREETTYEATVVRADGSTFPAEFRVRNLPYQGSEARVIAVRDVTRRKQHEAEILAAKEEAEAVAKLKSSLLNNMSHELRTPITSIVGYAELILNEPPEMHDEFAQLIKKSGKRLSETLNSVLDMAQIEAGTLTLSVSNTNVVDLAHEVAQLHRPSLGDQPITLSLDVRADRSMLHTDRRLVYRVLTNLVSNAVKFTSEGAITIRIDDAPEGLQVAVEDTGIGIERAFLPRLFDPFQQESQGLGRTFEGTGLGLAITQRMVDLLGGTITVDSVKGEGSVFTVVIPDAAHAEPAEVDEAAATPSTLS
jgi:PAS domain S-box-containing protein